MSGRMSAGAGKSILIALSIIPLTSVLLSAQPAQTLTLRNNHEIPFFGAVEIAAALPDGVYQSRNATATVSNGFVHSFASIGAYESVTMVRSGSQLDGVFRGRLSIKAEAAGLQLYFDGKPFGSVEFGLAVVPGRNGTVDDATKSFTPIPVNWIHASNGQVSGIAEASGYRVVFSVVPYPGGAIDIESRVSRENAPGGSSYLALVRRVVARGTSASKLRFNGREFAGGNSPATWDRDFWYTHGVDWAEWKGADLTFLAVNGFTPAPTIFRDGAWVEASHFYVWERARNKADTTFLISEIAGPNADQAKSRYMPVTPYAELGAGDTVSLKWRLAFAKAPTEKWEESQLRVFAGYRSAASDERGTVVDLGVPGVSFGTSYFPYSTLAENFDFYRTPGLSSENFWPMSPLLWAQWRKLVPRMRTDLSIIRAMGFESVRLHHLELLQKMERAEALAFLDFLTGETKSLGMHVMIDTEGPAEWVSSLMSRYGDVVTRVEIENEVLIGGIKPSDVNRWKALYSAVKAAAPVTQVIFTAAGNNAMFERLRSLGVPFDRVGLHAYKHGPQWQEAYSSHIMGTAGFASDILRPVTIGEFNWKDLTRMSPENRPSEVARIYESVLAPRAIPEFFEFQFQESLTFNPSVAGSYSRHYEPLGLDRRPKAEAFVLMKAIRKYSSVTSTVRELEVLVAPSVLTGDRGTSRFTVRNLTSRNISVRMRAVGYDGIGAGLKSPAAVTLSPRSSLSGVTEIYLTGDKGTGTYHHFVDVSYEGKRAIGWGFVSRPGVPRFSANSVLGDRVVYPDGIDVVARVRWNRPLAVAYGTAASVLELESAYQLATTLQSATGRPVRISSVTDLPDSVIARGTVILVGTPASNAMIPAVNGPESRAGRAGAGSIWIMSSKGKEMLVLSGSDARAVQAAVVELELRYWPNAKDATIRLTGMEKGAALGNRIGGPAVDPP